MKRLLLLAVLLTITGCTTVNDNRPEPVLVEQTQIEIPDDLFRTCARPAEQRPMREDEKLKHDVDEARKLVNCGRRHHAVINLLCRALKCNATIPPY